METVLAAQCGLLDPEGSQIDNYKQEVVVTMKYWLHMEELIK